MKTIIQWKKNLINHKTIVNIPISFGIYLKHFIAQTVDTNHKPFAKSDETSIYKDGILEGFNIYWNCHHLNPGTLIIQQNDFNKDKVTLLSEFVKEFN